MRISLLHIQAVPWQISTFFVELIHFLTNCTSIDFVNKLKKLPTSWRQKIDKFKFEKKFIEKYINLLKIFLTCWQIFYGTFCDFLTVKNIKFSRNVKWHEILPTAKLVDRIFFNSKYMLFLIKLYFFRLYHSQRFTIT